MMTRRNLLLGASALGGVAPTTESCGSIRPRFASALGLGNQRPDLVVRLWPRADLAFVWRNVSLNQSSPHRRRSPIELREVTEQILVVEGQPTARRDVARNLRPMEDNVVERAQPLAVAQRLAAG
jgi:hypothetical protein